MVDWLQMVQLGGVIAALFIALFGYMYNAREQRRLYRNKIQYETKLKAFNDFIAASRGVVNAYETFRALNARLSLSDNAVESGLIFASFAQDLERPLCTSVCVGIANRLEELNDKLVDSAHTGRVALSPQEEDVLAGAVSSLEIIFRRVFSFHHERMAIAFENAIIVMATRREFVEPAKDYIEYLEPAFFRQGDLLADFFKGRESKVSQVADGQFSQDEILTGKWLRVQLAMIRDLAATL